MLWFSGAQFEGRRQLCVQHFPACGFSLQRHLAKSEIQGTGAWQSPDLTASSCQIPAPHVLTLKYLSPPNFQLLPWAKPCFSHCCAHTSQDPLHAKRCESAALQQQPPYWLFIQVVEDVQITQLTGTETRTLKWLHCTVIKIGDCFQI